MNYTENKANLATAHKVLMQAKSLNRPVKKLKNGVTGEMLFKKPTQPSYRRNFTLNENAERSREEAKELFELGLPVYKIAIKMRRSRNTIHNYFNQLLIENGKEWGDKFKRVKK